MLAIHQSNHQRRSDDLRTSLTTPSPKDTKRKYACSKCQDEDHKASTCPYKRLSSKNHDSLICRIIKEQKSIDFQPPRRHSGKALIREEINMILRVYYASKAESKVKLIRSTNAIDRTALYCGVSNKTIYKLVSDFENNRKVTLNEHHQNLVNNANKKGETVSVKKLQNELRETMKEEYVHITRQTFTRLLHLMGFNFDKANKTRNFEDTEMIRLWRRSFLKKRLRINRERPDTLLLYLDESYCNQHYVGGKTWYRPGDLVRRGKRERRWVILHCGGEEGWIGEPLLFEAKSRSGDYHRNMNASIFEKYFKDLCKYTKAHLERNNQQGRSVVFVMDNAAYHKRVEGRSRGVYGLRKAELVEWMEKCNATDEEMKIKDKSGELRYKTKIDPLAVCRKDPARFRGKPIVEIIAEEAGFEVLWLPPYHPMLNPIEEAWGITKGYVADTNDGRDFNKVRELILEGMRRIKQVMWESLVDRAHENERKMIEKYHIEEDFPEPFVITGRKQWGRR
jgi:transposase